MKCVIINLGNILKFSLKSGSCGGEKEGCPCKESKMSDDPGTKAQYKDVTEDTDMMDFESGIDTWVIDKDDTTGSQVSMDKTRIESIPYCTDMKTMDKENIKKLKKSSEKKSLRHYRLQKSISHQDISSGSESDSKWNLANDSSSFNSKKHTLNSSHVSLLEKSFPKSKLHCSSSNSSLNSLNEGRKEKVGIGSEEIISIILSEEENSSDSIQEKSRERLLSIENVSVLADNSSDVSLTSLKPSFNCSSCNCEFRSLEELRNHESVHKITSFPISSQQPEQLSKLTEKPNTKCTWNKTDFFSTFKSHLINQGAMSAKSSNMTTKKVIEKSNKDEIKKSKYSSNKGQNFFRCNLCSYCCSELLIFKTHEILFHSGEESLSCEYCEFQTSQCANLATHIRVHFKIDCPFCEFQCTLKTTLETHLKNHHAESDMYKCKKCDFTSGSRKKLKKHLQCHFVKIKFQCEDCKQFFSSKQYLKIHIQKHSVSNKMFRCELCGLCFAQKLHLKLHKRSHEKEYTCDTCDSTFTHKFFLKAHMKTHVQKSYKCEKCNSTFTRKNYLKLHMRIHTPKNTKCQHCSFQCSDLNGLSKHNCINKLYAVEKRPLNFTSEDSHSILENDKSQKLNNIIKKRKLSTEISEANRKRKIEEINLEETYEEGEEIIPCQPKNRKNKKQRKNVNKLLCLRQNLPSRIQSIVENVHEDKNDRNLNKQNHSKQTLRVKKGQNQTRKPRINGFYKTGPKKNTWLISTKQNTITRRPGRPRKQIKLDQISNGVSCAELLIQRRPIHKELFAEPIRLLVNESFVQCYYQGQPSTSVQEHVARHLQQRALLSCRYCKYKTNSSQLLEHHMVHNHKWSPAIINMLFS